MVTFSTKNLHFPGGVPKKTKKNKDFGLFKPRLCQDSKIFGCLVFFFLEGYQKNQKKTKDFGLFRPRLRQDSKIFGFFGFLVPPQEMATFSTKSLQFPGGVPKKPKKTKILDSSGLRQDSKIFGFFDFFLVPPQEMATFSTKSLHFPGGVPQKPKKTKDFGLFRPCLRQDSKIFGFLGFFGTSSGTGNISFPGYSACSLQYLIVV